MVASEALVVKTGVYEIMCKERLIRIFKPVLLCVFKIIILMLVFCWSACVNLSVEPELPIMIHAVLICASLQSTSSI